MTGSGVVVWPRARTTMRGFRPTVWLVLQDVALDAEWRDGRLVASTSARLVAEHLRIDPSTAASGLRVLRDRGVVELSQAAGANGRFGLATYTLHLPDGIEAMSPHTEESYTVDTDTVTAGRDDELVLSCPWDGADQPSPQRQSSHAVQPHTVDGQRGGDRTNCAPAGVEVPSSHRDPTRTEVSCIVDAHIDPGVPAGRPARRRRSAATASVEQGAFDLGEGAR